MIFPSPAEMSITKLSLAGKSPARESLVSEIPAGDGKTDNFFTVYMQETNVKGLELTMLLYRGCTVDNDCNVQQTIIIRE
jgi:hypothetical protein